MQCTVATYRLGPGVEKPPCLIDMMQPDFTHEADGKFFVQAPVQGFLALWIGRNGAPGLFLVPLRPDHDGIADRARADEGQ